MFSGTTHHDNLIHHEDDGLPIFTREEIAKHNTESDAWIIIHGKVYNITNFARDHPGGEIIFTNVGKDSSALFEEFGHGDNPREMMKKFLIGRLDPKQMTRVVFSEADSPLHNVKDLFP